MRYGPLVPRPSRRKCANMRSFASRNTVEIGHRTGRDVRGLLAGIAGLLRAGRDGGDADAALVCRSLNAACEADIEIAKKYKRPTLKHCLEAKPFEPQAEILLPTSDAMLAFIGSGLLTHPEMVGLNPEYLHELMWGGAPRAALARAFSPANCATSISTTATV